MEAPKAEEAANVKQPGLLNGEAEEDSREKEKSVVPAAAKDGAACCASRSDESGVESRRRRYREMLPTAMQRRLHSRKALAKAQMKRRRDDGPPLPFARGRWR